MNQQIKIIFVLCLSLAACKGGIKNNLVKGGVDPALADEVVGAGGRAIGSTWDNIDVPFSKNTKMLNFSMMKSEVQRATGATWIGGSGQDLWAPVSGTLGHLDMVNRWAEDRVPDQKKLITLRKMSFAVCEKFVNEDSQGMFSSVDLNQKVGEQSAAAEAQISLLYERFFLSKANETEVAQAMTLLQAIEAQGSSSTEAWIGLCSAYTSSMRFLSY